MKRKYITTILSLVLCNCTSWAGDSVVLYKNKDVIVESRLEKIEKNLGLYTESFLITYSGNKELTLIVKTYINGKFSERNSTTQKIKLKPAEKETQVSMIITDYRKSNISDLDFVQIWISRYIKFYIDKPGGLSSGNGSFRSHTDMQAGKEYLIKEFTEKGKENTLNYKISLMFSPAKNNDQEEKK